MSEIVKVGPRLPNAGSAPQVLSAVVPDPPRSLVGIDSGTILRGVVQGRDADGLLIVTTDKGSLKLATNAQLSPGTPVTLEVKVAGDRLQVLILGSDQSSGSQSSRKAERAEVVSSPRGTTQQQSASGTNSNANMASAPKGGVTAPQQVPPAPIAVVGSVLEGIIVQASPETLAQLLAGASAQKVAAEAAKAVAQNEAALKNALSPDRAIPATQKPGAAAPTQLPNPVQLPQQMASALQPEVRAKIEALFGGPLPGQIAAGDQTPAAAGNTGNLSAQATVARPLGLQSVLPLLPGQSQSFTDLVTGSDIKIRLLAIAEAAGQSVTLPADAGQSGRVIAGRIVGHTPNGNTVIQTPFGAVVLQRHLALPVGAEIAFSIDQAAPAASAVPLVPSATPQQTLLAVSRGWPTLAEVIAIFRQQAPAPEAQALMGKLPQSGPRLAAGLVAAMQAMRSGDLESLLGAAVRTRGNEGAREDSVRRLRQEFAQISPFAGDRPDSEWRCYFLPLLDDGTIRQINLFYRRNRRRKDKDEKDDKAGTRFVVEVDFSRLGPFQFDGLVREKRFDLMIRSRIPLDGEMKQQIAEIFDEAVELGGYNGSVMFQAVKEFPISPLDEIARSATNLSA